MAPCSIPTSSLRPNASLNANQGISLFADENAGRPYSRSILAEYLAFRPTPLLHRLSREKLLSAESDAEHSLENCLGALLGLKTHNVLNITDHRNRSCMTGELYRSSVLISADLPEKLCGGLRWPTYSNNNGAK